METPPIQVMDCISPQVLRPLLDAFTAATGCAAVIHDRTGRSVLDEACEPSFDGPAAPILVEGHSIATLRLSASTPAGGGTGAGSSAPVASLTDAAALLEPLAQLLSHTCELALRLRERTEEMMALSHLSTLLSGRREPQVVLETVTRSVTELMGVKAAAIRLLDAESGQELRVVAVYNLSPEYLNKGPIMLTRSIIDQRALEGEVMYVQEMATDPRVLYPEDARREGLASMLCIGMVYRGKPVGVLRIYTGEPRAFSSAELNLLRGVSQLAGAFIRNAQLDAERQEQMRIQRQVELAADVQRRLLPAGPPDVPPFEVYGRYEPCFELGGDFYDFIPLPHGLGLVVGDVVGKGVAAGLLMAAVRATLRAHIEDIYDIDQIMSKANAALARDTRDNEFATVFYGTVDTRTRRLTYCSAGHEPGLLLRDGKFIDLDIGGIPLGIDAAQTFDKGLVDLLPGDVLLLYTDGVTDASSFEGKRFGRERVRQAVVAASSGGGSARDIVNHVLWETRRYVGLNYRPDDMSIVAVRVH